MKMSGTILMLFAATLAFGDVPSLIHYQGRLTHGTNLVSGTVGLSLRLYNVPAGGALLYEDSNTVTVTDGLYSTWIGDNTIAGSLPAALTNAQVWLEVSINGSPLTPRERVAAVAYAMIADGVRTGGITSAMLASGAVQAVHLATGSVWNEVVATAAITGDKIALGTITADRVVTGAFVYTAGDVMTGPLTNQQLIAAPRYENLLSTVLAPGSIALGGHQNLISANSFNAVIGGGTSNRIFNSVSGTIGGGESNAVYGAYSTIAGGQYNQAVDNHAFVGGGFGNYAKPTLSVIGGGGFNRIEGGLYGLIGGGFRNRIEAIVQAGTIAGGEANQIVNSANYAAIGGGFSNRVDSSASYGVVAGGERNLIRSSAEGAFVGSGLGNEAAGLRTVVGGGYYNKALGPGSVVVGGYSNLAGGMTAFVGGGGHNGFFTYLPNVATGASSAVVGGLGNTAGGWASAVPGGCLNEAGGLASMAGGYRAKAVHDGTFVWADFQGSDFASSRSNQFCVRAGGGVALDTGWDSPGILMNGADRAMITRGFDAFTSGVHRTAGRWGLFMEPSALVLGMPAIGGKVIRMVKYNADSTYTTLMTLDQSGNMTIAGTYSPPSDRELKHDFEEVSGSAILDKIAAMPIQTWRYRHEENGPRHIGPTAQDFHAAFGLGADDRHIATVDADGVALAAIQELARQNAELREELAAVKALLMSLTDQSNRQSH